MKEEKIDTDSDQASGATEKASIGTKKNKRIHFTGGKLKSRGAD